MNLFCEGNVSNDFHFINQLQCTKSVRISNVTHISLHHNVLYKQTELVILLVISKYFNFKAKMINIHRKESRYEKNEFIKP